jgi:hypothetical protein
MKAKVMLSKDKLKNGDLEKIKFDHEVIREDDKEIVVMSEDGAALAKVYEGLQEMNEA